MLRRFLPEMCAGNYFAPVRRKELLSNPTSPCSENFFSEQALRRLDTLTRIFDRISYRLRALLLPFLVKKGRRHMPRQTIKRTTAGCRHHP